jgi:hypothetical protein
MVPNKRLFHLHGEGNGSQRENVELMKVLVNRNDLSCKFGVYKFSVLIGLTNKYDIKQIKVFNDKEVTKVTYQNFI